ncbi:hypothetical protein NL108_000730 [Boleophthalmus pectinirostris]|nr:hypothetical protein NL108_000730 [Boleophthalmus pectinirostris]
MGLLLNHTETLDPSEPSTHWESTSQLSAAAVDAIVVLGVLTFALQLCLVLYFLFRFWRLDYKVEEALKQPQYKPQNNDTLLHLQLCRTIDQPQCESTTYVSTKSSESHDLYEPVDAKHHYFGISIPWDLVQR